MNTHNATNEYEWEDILIEYMFGAMSQDESVRFASQLEECRSHAVLAQQYTEIFGTLGQAVAPVEPPVGHKDRFMARLTATPQESQAPIKSVAGERLLTVVGAPEQHDSKEPVAVTPRSLDDARTEREARRKRSSISLAPVFATVAAGLILFLGVALWAATNANNDLNVPPGYTAFVIPGKEPYTASAVAIFNPSNQDTLVYANGLEALPEGKVYELWLLPPSGNPVAAGSFRGDASGRARYSHIAPQRLDNYAGFAVTIEDGPGRTAPGGPIIMAGNYR